MHALILGGNGFVGSRVAMYLATRAGWTVEVLGSKDCDLVQPESVALLRKKVTPKTDILFCSTISRLRDDSIKAFYKNVQMAENVASALSSCKYRSIVFCSSIDVYGRPPSQNPITESTCLNPAGYYGHSKLVSEYILATELGYDRRLAILRLPGVYSLDEADPSALGTIFSNLKFNRPVLLSGAGKQVRTYLNIAEFAAVVEDIFKRRWAGLVNLGSPETCSVKEAAETLKRLLASSSEIRDAESNGSEFDIVISSEKARTEFPSVRFMSLEKYFHFLHG